MNIRIVLQNHEKKLLDQEISPFEKSLGIISVEQFERSNEFTTHVLDVDRIRYRFDPNTQTFALQFLSMKKSEKQKDEKKRRNK